MAKKLNVRVRESSTDVLYGKLLMYAEQVHQDNKRRIKNGLISLIVIPFVLVGILLLTDSSRIVFLIIWIACMFVVAAFLLYIAYSDWMLQATINELSRDELGEFDSLITVKTPRRGLIAEHQLFHDLVSSCQLFCSPMESLTLTMTVFS